jgi:hypothetical protein
MTGGGFWLPSQWASLCPAMDLGPPSQAATAMATATTDQKLSFVTM